MKRRNAILKKVDRCDRILSLVSRELSYRCPLQVDEIIYYRSSGDSYPMCPRCKTTFEREYIQYCDRCGQKLDWRSDQAFIVRLR